MFEGGINRPLYCDFRGINMKKINYQTEKKLQCKSCKHVGWPFIKMITFHNSEDFLVAAHCRKCGKYIDNVPRKNIKIMKGRK